jgi:hypothetical protein
VSNQVIERKPNGQFAKGSSGNLGGNAQRTRHIFNKAFLEALANDFREGGPQAIARVRKYQPAAYMKICALLIPKEMRVEHSGALKSLSDEQLEQMIEALQAMIDAQAGDSTTIIEGTAEAVALPAPVVPDEPVMDAADTAVGMKNRKSRKGRLPSFAGT